MIRSFTYDERPYAYQHFPSRPYPVSSDINCISGQKAKSYKDFTRLPLLLRNLATNKENLDNSFCPQFLTLKITFRWDDVDLCKNLCQNREKHSALIRDVALQCADYLSTRQGGCRC